MTWTWLVCSFSQVYHLWPAHSERLFDWFTTFNLLGNLPGLCGDSSHFTELLPTKKTMHWRIEFWRSMYVNFVSKSWNSLVIPLKILCLHLINCLYFCLVSSAISILFSCSWNKTEKTLKNFTQCANLLIQFSAFSLTSYVASHGLDLNHLSEIDLTYLYDELGISTYLSHATCNRSSEHYQPATDGWNNGEL